MRSYGIMKKAADTKLEDTIPARRPFSANSVTSFFESFVLTPYILFPFIDSEKKRSTRENSYAGRTSPTMKKRYRGF